MPKFSIIIPAFNRAKVLPRAIQSILNQTNKDWELIVVDDGSTDDTSNVISAYFGLLGFRSVYQENYGVSGARNLGATKSQGEWLIFLDSDDELIKDALENFSSFIDRFPGDQLFVAGNERRSFNETIIRIPKEGSYNPFLSGTFCIKKAFFDQIGGYDPLFTFSENTELLHRIMQASARPHLMPHVSLVYHENASGGSRNPENIINSVSLFLKKHQNSMSAHHKYLYNQIVGVNNLRVQRFGQAREYLWKAYLYKPWKIQTLARFGLSFLPILSKIIYTKKIGI
ncbi:glycosyltransferase family A protein [Algoriphagus sp. SE2]|uniref:glycosyltransferase family 2 protein n=1 Tax=Algoriphagus sp. SE2 TaxID=3141536 RepID=UPI0031CD110F